MSEGRGDIRFRVATVEDIEALADLRWQMVSEYHIEGAPREEYIAAYCETFRGELAQERYLAWLAEVARRPVACMMLAWWPMPPSLHELRRRRGFVSNVYTRSEYRRMGLARTLLEMVIAQARDLGITKLHLEASDMGRPLYLSMGFVVPERGLEITLQ